jgi:valyl-tRNA synthetase
MRGCRAAVLEVFVSLYKEGPDLQGQAAGQLGSEIRNRDLRSRGGEQVEVDGHLWHFKYPLAGGETYEHVEKDDDGNVTLRETRDYISIATTRPETMLGDTARWRSILRTAATRT